MGRDKLRVETRLKVAAAYDKKRFGATVTADVTMGISVMAALTAGNSRMLSRPSDEDLGIVDVDAKDMD